MSPPGGGAGEAEVTTRAVASMVITWSVAAPADPPALTKLTWEGGGAGKDEDTVALM